MEDENLEMLEACLSRMKKIGEREPLPTRHFFNEAQDIIRGSIDEAYKAGLHAGKTNQPTTMLMDKYITRWITG